MKTPMAPAIRFELMDDFTSPVFKTGAFGHSATPAYKTSN